jgi:Na+-translocating ferredoxin:NAD+ oxidoreductase RnfG subunit
LQPNEGTKNTLLVLVMFTIACALPSAAAVVPSAIAQEDNDESLASSILSEVLKDGDADDDETDQDSTNTATLNPNQDQTVDQDDTVIFGDDNADLDAANVAVPIALPISMEEVPPECPKGFTPENGQCRSTETTEPT